MSVGVVIVHYRRPDLLVDVVACLDSQTVSPVEVLVVNNGDPSDVPELKTALAIRYDHTMANLGYAGAVNRARGILRTDHVLVLTHDAELPPDGIEQLERALLSDDGLGAVGPTLFRRSSPGEVFSRGGWIGRGGVARHYRSAPGRTPGASDLQGVDWLDGAILLLRQKALDAVDWLEDRYFLYYEDVDLGLRLRRHGWRVAVHNGLRAYQDPGNYLTYLRFRNQVLFCRWNGRMQGLGSALAVQVLRSSLRWAREARPVNLAWALRGIRDGLADRSGQPPATWWRPRGGGQ